MVLAQKLYVPIVTVCLLLVFAHWFHGIAGVDPLLAAQNSRLRFQTSGDSSKLAEGLTTAESALAESVLQKNREPDGKHLELLYVGNSQTLAIMDPRPGDMVTPQWLQVLLSRHGSADPKAKSAPQEIAVRPIEVSLGSLPNITAPEMLIQLVAAGERTPRRVDILVASEVLEEFRGLGIRDDVAILASRPAVKAKLRSLLEQNADLETVHTSLEPVLHAGVSTSTDLINDDSHPSYAQRIEQRLQDSANKVSLFSDREDLRVQLSLGFHEWRNRLLRITTASARPVPDSSYRASLEMLELALRYAHSANIQVFVYLAPIRPIQPNPNLPSDVIRFRQDVPAICKRYDVKCFDYLDLVPESLWTNYTADAAGTEGQRDFAHFTGAAHKLLAERLVTDTAPQLRLAGQEEKISTR